MKYAARQAGTSWGMESDPRDDWRESAACRAVDPELFYPVGEGNEARYQAHLAKEVCRPCPVKAECLAFATATGEAWGIWGGMTPAERRGRPERPANCFCVRCNNEFAWDPRHPYARLCTSCDKRRVRSTVCARGHERTQENTYVHPHSGSRQCKPCKEGRDLDKVVPARRLSKAVLANA